MLLEKRRKGTDLLAIFCERRQGARTEGRPDNSACPCLPALDGVSDLPGHPVQCVIQNRSMERYCGNYVGDLGETKSGQLRWAVRQLDEGFCLRSTWRLFLRTFVSCVRQKMAAE